MRPSLLGTLLSVLVLNPFVASAAEPSPYDTLEPKQNVQILVALRDQLGAATADDPRLASAQMALINLALAGDPRDRGGRGGIWRHRARELRDLRHAAGVKADGFVAVVPDLWVDALDGRTADCIAGLDRFPGEVDQPHARALRCVATGDWRPLQGVKRPTAHERLALAIALCRSGLGNALERLDPQGLPPFALNSMLVAAVGFTHGGTAGTLQAALAACPAIAVSPHLPAPVLPKVDDVLDAARIAAGERATRVGQLARTLAGKQDDAGALLLACWRLADAATAGPTGLRDASAWRLITVGDWAASTRLWLFLGAWHRHNFTRFMWSVPDVADRLIGPVIASDEGVFAAWNRFMASEFKDEAAARAVLAGVDAELARGESGLPPMRLIGCAADVRSRQHGLRVQTHAVMRRLLDAQRAAESGRAAGWAEFGKILSDAGLASAAAADLRAAAAADPWSPELARLVVALDGQSIPLWTGAPVAQWTDAQVDHPTGVAKAGRPDQIGVRWTGSLVVPTPGRWRIATESDDGSALLLGGRLVVENGGDHAMQVVATEIDLPAGPIALDLRWYQGGGGAGCRLLWQEPGAGALTIIPTGALRTVDGAPGLSASAWHLAQTPSQVAHDSRMAVTATEFARLPWRLDLGAELFSRYFERRNFAEALAISTAVLAVDPGNETVGRAHGRCLKELGRMDEALAAWRSYLATSTAFDTIFTRIDIAETLEARKELTEAERIFREAAASGQAGAMLTCARFLGRIGKVREGLDLVVQCEERYSNQYGLSKARVLLGGAPGATEIDEAFTHLATASDRLGRDPEAWDVGMLVRRLGLHDRFLAIAEPAAGSAPNVLPILIALLQIESGRPAEGAAELKRQIGAGRDGHGGTVALQALGARLARRPDLAPTPDELRRCIGSITPFLDSADALLGFLAGDLDRAAALTRAGSSADELRYYLALDSVARGDLAAARADLQAVEKHPDWSEHGAARRFLAWVDAGGPGAPAVVPGPTSDF